MSTEQNKALVRQLLEEIFNRGNISLADEFLAPHFVEREELLPGMPPGREGVKQFATIKSIETPNQRVEARVKDLADTLGQKHGLNRRRFLARVAGMAAAFGAIKVFGSLFELSSAAAHVQRKPGVSARSWGALGATLALLVGLSTLACVGFPGWPTPLPQAGPQPEAYFNQTLIPPDVPSEVLIGETFKFNVRFKNTGNAIGFGPFIDLVLDSGGADLNTSAGPCDGITFVSATMVAVNPPLALNSFPVGPAAPCPGGPTSPLAHPYGGAPFGPVTVPLGAQLVTIELPFGSFDPSQPEIVVEVTAKVHNFADVNQPLKIYARGGFRYGATATGGTPILELGTTTNASTWENESVTPTFFKIKKEYLGPEDEAVAGPNFVNYYPLKYKITVDIADGQEIYKLRVIDNLSNSLQYHGNLKVWIHGTLATQVSAVAGCPTTSPLEYQLNQVPLPGPGGQLEVQFCDPIKGQPQTSPMSDQEVVIEFEFYIPNNVLGPNCAPVLAKNDVLATGLWDPLDPRDPNPSDPPGTLVLVKSDITTDDHILYAKCLAIQKYVKVHIDTGAPGATPGDTLKYTLRFQISDYHTIGKLNVRDFLGDGQALVGPASTLTVTDQFGQTSGNFTLNTNLTATLAPTEVCTVVTPAQTVTVTGGTVLQFDVSAAMNTLPKIPPTIPRHSAGILTGGWAAGLPTSNMPATGEIVFYARIEDEFKYQGIGANKYVDKHDPMINCVTIEGRVYTNVNKPTPINDPSNIPSAIIGPTKDGSATQISIVTDILKKSVYRVWRGITVICGPGGPPCPIPPAAPDVRPGDQVTFRIQYSIPSGDAQNVVITDWLPLPVFDVSDPDANPSTVPPGWPATVGPTCAGTATPLPGNACLMPSHTLTIPTLTTSPPAAPATNSLTFDFGTFNNIANTPQKIDLLFTITVTNKPFADGLFLTNEAQECEKNTFGVTFCQVAIAQVKVREPKLGIRKGVIATNNSNGVFTINNVPAPLTAGLPVGAPPNVPATAPPRFTPPINSTNLGGFIGRDLINVDAGDWVTFAIAIENTGGAPAYNISLRDIIPWDAVNKKPSCFEPTFGGLSVTYGNGTPIPFTTTPFLGGVITINLDPNAPLAPGSPVAPLNGTNIVIITFEAQLLDKDKLKSGCCDNKAELIYYGSTPPTPTQPPNGSVPPPNFVAAGFGGPFVDTAKVCVGPRPYAKCIQRTSEAHTTPPLAAMNGTVNAAIGEIVRFRLTTVIPEGTTLNFQIQDLLPLGLTYVGNPRAIFVANSPVAITGHPPIPTIIPGNETTVKCPGPPPPPAIPAPVLITVSPISFPFGTGTDPNFPAAPIITIKNNDNDSNLELLIIEFNAQVDNILGNQASTNLPDRFVVRYQDAHTNQTVTSPQSGPVTVHIVEPNLTLTKTANPTSVGPGGTVNYNVTITNPSTPTAATAFNVVFTDMLPADLTLVAGSVTATCAGAIIAPGINVTCPQVPVAPALGSTVTITYKATVSPTVRCPTTLTNTAKVTWTSLPGPQGTPINPTGQQTVGPSGAANGERNGVTTPLALNDYAASATIEVVCPKDSATPSATDTPTPTDTPMPTGTQGNCIIAPPDMVAWWAMDDVASSTSTTITDNSAGGHTGSLLDTALGSVAIGNAPGGTVVVSVPPGGAWPGSVLFPQAGNALFFVRTFALVASNPVFDIGQNGLTITLWFNTAGAITPIQPLLDKWDVNSNSGYSLYLDSWDGNNKTYALKFNLNNTVIAFPTPIPSPTISGSFPWYLVAVTVQNNGAVTLYINSPNSQVPSSLQGATYTSSVASWQVSNTVTLGIAGNRSLLPPILSGNNPYQRGIGGYPAAELALDEVEIFNRALNLTTEIQSLYNLESQGVQKCQ